MAPALDCHVSKTFMNLEIFLQKVAALDIFEALIFNYKVKIDLQEPISIHFLTFVTEFASQLQLVIEETNVSKQLPRPENCATRVATDSYDVDEDKPSEIEDDNDACLVTSEPPPTEDSPRKRLRSRGALPKQQRKSKRLTKQELLKEKEAFFKVLSSSKVDSMLDEGREGQEEEEGVTELPFFCCNTCVEVYRTMSEYDGHECKEEKQEKGGAEPTSSCGLTSKLLITRLDRLKAAKSFKCGLCREEYRSYDRIVYHLPRCAGGPYACQLCQEEYRYKSDLNVHKKLVHRKEKSFFCDECDVSFQRRTSLQKHQLNRHEHEQTYPCAYCGQRFNKRILLTNHNISVHALEKKYLCQVCGKKFFTHGSLVTHLVVHSEPRRFSCAYCPKRFQQKEKLTFHTRIHTGERPHLCQTCGKRFIRKSKLDEHMRRHRGEKRFVCNVCHKTYAGNWDLKIHIKKKHSRLAESSSTDPDSLKTVDKPAVSVKTKQKRTKSNKASSQGESSSHADETSQLGILNQSGQSDEDLVNRSHDIHNHSSLNQNNIILQLPTTQNVHIENNISQRIILMDSLQMQNQSLVLNGNDENTPRIIVLNSLQNQHKSDESRILVQLDSASGSDQTLHNDNRVYVQLDAANANSVMAVSSGMQMPDNVLDMAQYIQIQNAENTGLVQYPVNAGQVSTMSGQAGSFGIQPVSNQSVVYAPGFHINNMTY